jgi:uncharacterized membrane protein
MTKVENEHMSDRSLKWILLVSLMVNAALVGFTAAQFMRPHPPFLSIGHAPPHMHEISDKERTVLDAAFAAERPAFEKALSDMVVARDKSVTLIRATPLDVTALDGELAKMRAANMAAQESFHRVIRTAAQQFDQPERDRLSNILRDAPPGHGGPHGPLGPPHDAPWMPGPQPPVYMPGEHPEPGATPPPR